MNPLTMKTILSSAPAIIEIATSLIKHIKDRKDEPTADERSAQSVSGDNLTAAISRIESRLDATDESNVEQIKLIEQLARQNEMLAASLQRTFRRFTFVFILALAALLVAIAALFAR